VPGQFLICPWAEAGTEVPTPGHTVPDATASRRSDVEVEDGSGLDWVDCPECGLPAYVVDRFVRPSTDGPLPHAVTVCARMHHLCMTEDAQIDPGAA
jgi:hypothetical protein